MTQIIIYYAIAVVFTIFGFVLAGIMSSGKQADYDSELQKIKVKYYQLGKKQGKKEGYEKAHEEIKYGDTVHWSGDGNE